ncbi:MAG: MlaD family protein [Pseudomonadota bacterium]
MQHIRPIRYELIGLCFWLCTIFLFSIIIQNTQLSRADQDSYIHISADFNDVTGLKIGSPVLMSGIEIGKVTALSLNQDYKVKVEFTANKTIDLPLDSSVAIYSDNIFGSKYVYLETGGSFDFLEDGDELIYTQDSIDFVQILDRLITASENKRQKERSN